MQVGNIKRLRTELTSPIELKIDCDINQLNVLAGQNGSGKSFVLVLSYAIHQVMNDLLMKGNNYSWILSKCFKSPVTGLIGCEFENAWIEVKLEESRVVDIKYDLGKVNTLTKAIYLSSNMRTFSNVDMYVKLRKTMSPEQLCDIYPHYDVMYVEMLLAKCPFELKLSEAQKILVEATGLEIESFVISYDNGFKIGDKHISSLNSGSQAILTMLIAGLL